MQAEIMVSSGAMESNAKVDVRNSDGVTLTS
jgi:hypothetical protein